MKIIELRAENIKRLKAVTITPDGNMQVIGGRNAQGKTSVLDAIWLALGGGRASKNTKAPIRDGETRASVRLDLGDLIVTRTWDQSGTKLQVTSADGYKKYTSPQKMLDELIGRLSFDPLAFTRLDPSEQREALLDLVDLDVDLDTLDTERQDLYERRTQIGRQAREIGEPDYNPDMPTEETPASQVIERLRQAENQNRERAQQEDRTESFKQEVLNAQRALAEAEANLHAVKDQPLPELVDTAPIEQELDELEESNAQVRANNTEREKLERRQSLDRLYDEHTDKIEALDRQKRDALNAAQFPIDGLGFGDQGVTHNGVPFTQASSAEQITVSLAMAMALNPKLKVLRITDGSLLDADTMNIITQAVKDNDYQLWIERVGDADHGAVIIEDGEVAA